MSRKNIMDEIEKYQEIIYEVSQRESKMIEILDEIDKYISEEQKINARLIIKNMFIDFTVKYENDIKPLFREIDLLDIVLLEKRIKHDQECLQGLKEEYNLL